METSNMLPCNMPHQLVKIVDKSSIITVTVFYTSYYYQFPLSSFAVFLFPLDMMVGLSMVKDN